MDKNKRIVVAMSGGVDSSTAAFLLKEAGYDVIGVTMHVWNFLPEDHVERFGSCCSLEDVSDARRVADMLNIPFYVMNMEEVFKREVVDYFISSYLSGLTPNPCILCNKIVKFDSLMERIKKIGGERLATGHYAIIDNTKQGHPILKRGIDKTKDQSYFLFNLTRGQLDNILFPLGGMKKSEIREIARSARLPVAEKGESQEICFVNEKNYGDFIRRVAGGKTFIKEGDIINSKGEVLGRHKGIIYYTIGQRKGLGIGASAPLYVIAIDKKNNTILVGGDEELSRETMIVKQVNWLLDIPEGEIEAQVQIRYRHKAETAVIKILEAWRVEVIFDNPQRAITPGQAAVFYKDDAVIGGGWIE